MLSLESCSSQKRILPSNRFGSVFGFSSGIGTGGSSPEENSGQITIRKATKNRKWYLPIISNKALSPSAKIVLLDFSVIWHHESYGDPYPQKLTNIGNTKKLVHHLFSIRTPQCTQETFHCNRCNVSWLTNTFIGTKMLDMIQGHNRRPNISIS